MLKKKLNILKACLIAGFFLAILAISIERIIKIFAAKPDAFSFLCKTFYMSEIKSSKPAILILEDGNVFHGQAFGKTGTTTGEICFNTGMTGYQEVFTDPSYYGQVVIMNNVHIGNYGINEADVESDSVKVKGIIGRNLEEQYSRFAADDSLQEYFEKQNIVAIDGIDTRALVIHIREAGRHELYHFF